MRRHGWEVMAASCLSEARPLLQTQPDVLILDLMLPDGEGTTLLKEVRDNHWPTNVVVVTGTSDSARLTRVRQLEPDTLLFKPVDLQQLLQAVRESGSIKTQHPPNDR
jgi:DNA-binding response OmpR family regulator